MGTHEIEVLLVEDTLSDAELTLRAFRKYNFHNHVTWVKDGTEALDFLFCAGKYAGRPAVLPDLVLMDLKMPKINGLELIQRMRADPRAKTVPIVMLTSSAEHPDLTRAYEFGVNSYLVKPVEFAQFMDVVSKAGVYWGTMNVTAPQAHVSAT